ncbi:MAG: type IV secretion system DNA-binding domain-containing protein [Desulfovibrio sp.]|jgi:intracellular multiplication protein IcmO|nr:type IV secretion system DNA-binding domain-containing protein [Desulfovibrio sp.]
MPPKRIFGIDPSQEQRQDELIRDVRTPLARAWETIMTREGFLIAAVFTAASLALLPAYWPFEFGIFLFLFFIRKKKTEFSALPMRMPDSYSGIDYGGELPAKGKYGKAEGMFYIGNDSQGRELWINKDDILTHMLILGTTGAGKTETLVSLAYNYLAVASGFIYVDPKAAPKLAVQLYTMSRILGRDDDFLLLNYMADKAAQETMRTKGHMRTPQRQSNTQNPFAVGTANQLSQLLFAMMPGGGNNEGGNAIFGQNAQTLISGLLFVLAELRDKGWKPLYIDLIRRYLMDSTLIQDLANGKSSQGDPPMPSVSGLSMAALHSGLATVGWQKGTPADKQPKNFPEQYGYARAYFGRALSLLVDNYGRIFKTSHGEVDPVDIITSRRIFLTLIPSMDKDPKELKSLGQICLAGVRNACGVGLGDKVQGDVPTVLGGLPTDARTPFGITVDEYAAIETPGFEILLTQGRGLGIAVTVASQDFAGIKRASEAAAEQIVSNSKVKIFMTTEDPRSTFELMKSLGGEAIVLQTGGFSVDKQAGKTNYYDTLSASTQRVSRVDFRDMQKQVEGQFHLSFKGNLIRGKTFYANPPLESKQFLRLNYHLKVEAPRAEVDDLRTNFGPTRDYGICLRVYTLETWKDFPETEPPDDIASLCDVFERYISDMGNVSKPEVAIEAFFAGMDNFGEIVGSPAQTGPDMDDLLGDVDPIGQYTKRRAALPEIAIYEDLAEVEKAAGAPESLAASLATENEKMINEALQACMARSAKLIQIYS